MRHSILLSLLMLGTAAGCGAGEDVDASNALPIDEEATGDEKADWGNWRLVTRCDGGAVVDVREGERTQMQLVIKNDAAAAHLMGNAPYLTKNWTGELIITGSSSRGVFYPWDFERFTGYSYEGPTHAVFRDWGGVKVVIYGYTDERTCKYVDENQGYWDCTQKWGEKANWFFPSCR